MPLPRWLTLCGRGTHACACGICTVVLWTCWLLLAIALALQLIIVSVREVAVPTFVLRQVEQRLASAGLQASFGRARFDPAGHVLVHDLELTLNSDEDPVLRAETILIQIDPWALLLRDVEVQSITLSGGELLVSAMFSPSGRSEPFINDIDASVELGDHDRELILHHLTARAGAWRLQGHGRAELPKRADPENVPGRWLNRVAATYPRWSGQTAGQLARLPAVDDGVATFELEPGRLNTVVRAAELKLPPELAHLPAPVHVSGLHVAIDATLDDAFRAQRAQVRTAINAIDAGADGRLQHVSGRLTASRRPDRPWRANRALFGFGSFEREGFALGPTGIEAALDGWPQVRIAGVGHAFGSTWSINAGGSIDQRDGDVRFTGSVTPRLLALAGERVGRDLDALVQAESPPRFEGRVVLAAGGRPINADVRLSTGPVVARNVALDRTSGHVFWSPGRVHVEDIVLATGPSEARGTYTMDTTTRDFRFLLSGRLEPAAINGWFRDWWTKFWERFDFGARTPVADVDVRGRWGRPHETRVFVAADGEQLKLQGADFDRVRTRLFVRPGWTDVVEFIGERAGRAARGSFSRQWQPGEPGWRSLEFDVEGNIDHEPAPALFGDLGRTITAPFTWQEPPALRVKGRLERDTQETPVRSDVEITGETPGAWSFHGFPLHDLRFHARLKDETLRIDRLATGFAGGRVTGRIDVEGLRTARLLAFQLAMNDARLGESIRTLETWSAMRKGLPPPPESRFQQRLAPGMLDLALSASGHYDDLYSLHGNGTAVITGADLAEINLLGVLSTILRRTIFNFTTLELGDAQASFILAGRALHFHELRLSGRRAAIEATGNYALDTKELDFNARILPFDASEGFLGSTVGVFLTPLSHALEVKLGGTLAQPDWVFLYGPTSLLRAITGSNPRFQPEPILEPLPLDSPTFFEMPAEIPETEPDAEPPSP